ncbi:NosD domain-containing protein [Methanococcoides vulcani]|nr:NosD domain-containing protein [Methanococcoides vulcani]
MMSAGTAVAILTSPDKIVLTQENDTNTVGTEHTVTATVDDADGFIVGATVTFNVTSGPHIGVNGTDTTDANGNATFTYTGTAPGTDTIKATHIDPTYGECNDTIVKTWTAVHNIDSGKNFSTIQAAIDDSGTFDGHTIVVDKGIYTENVDVNKELTIISESGNPDDTHVQANNSSVHVFNVTADRVTISGFDIKGAIAPGKAGIYLDNSSNSTLTSNTVASHNDYGIYLKNSEYNNLTSNTVGDNYVYGIYLKDSDYNNLTSNTASNNYRGIELYSSSNNTLTNNTASNNVGSFGAGIYLEHSSNYNNLTSNTATGNDDYGI